MEKPRKIAWGMTGSGEMIKEIYNIMLNVKRKSDIEIMAFLSKEAETVLKWYKMWEDTQNDFPEIQRAFGPNEPFIAGPL